MACGNFHYLSTQNSLKLALHINHTHPKAFLHLIQLLKYNRMKVGKEAQKLPLLLRHNLHCQFPVPFLLPPHLQQVLQLDQNFQCPLLLLLLPAHLLVHLLQRDQIQLKDLLKFPPLKLLNQFHQFTLPQTHHQVRSQLHSLLEVALPLRHQ